MKPKYIIRVFTEASASWDTELRNFIEENKEELFKYGYVTEIIDMGSANRCSFPMSVSCINLILNK